MFNLTKTEKYAICFISASIILGAFVHIIKVRSHKPFQIFNEEILKKSNKPIKIVNINTAMEQDLVSLEDIGPALAQRIIAYRDEFGRFRLKEDLIKVKGIGPSKFAKIKDYISCD